MGGTVDSYLCDNILPKNQNILSFQNNWLPFMEKVTFWGYILPRKHISELI